MPFAETPTILPLERFAQILGINPVHFAGGSGGDVWPTAAYCGQVWPQYTWQVPDTMVSREEVAQAIFSAEQDITRALGYPPGLSYIGPETHSLNALFGVYPGDPHWSAGSRWTARLLKLRNGKIVGGGQQTPITNYGALIPLVYDDIDGDGYDEIARIPNPEADPATKPDLRNWRFFMPDEDSMAAEIGDPVELRSARVRTIAGVHFIEFDSWHLFRRQLLTFVPAITGFQKVPIEQPGSYVSGVYAVFDAGNELPAAVLKWPPGTACGEDACPICSNSLASVDGCLAIADAHLGMVYPVPGTCTDGVWTAAPICNRAYPNDLTVWYRAGLTSKAFEAGTTSDPLDNYWAQTIAWLAASRLDKPVCGCTNVQAVVSELQRDLAVADNNNNMPNVDFNLLGNPFGTRVGEVRAWKRVAHFANDQIMDSGTI